MSDSPSELNMPQRRRYSWSHSDFHQSIFEPIGDFLNLFGLSTPFRRRPKADDSSSDRFYDLYASSLNKEHIELAQLPQIFHADKLGIGHEFLPAERKTPTWCDLCGEFLWGFYKARNCVHCKYCNYTCHMRCRPLVTLDCTANPLNNHTSPALECVPSFQDISELSPLFEDVIDEENCDISEFTTATLSSVELKKQIETYNLNVASGEIKLLEDGHSFSGFIRVHMRLCRPVNVYTVPRPPSIYDVLNDYSTEGTADNKKTLTSFYLPRDTVKALHITSETTTKDVIITLLNKFKVVDNPHKFALYERDYEIGESTKVRMRRIQDCEYPLRMILMWHNQGHTGRHLVLQENDTGDISWDAFSLPELNNFLTILKREEEEYLQQVRLKYNIMGEKLHEALQERERLRSEEASKQQIAPQPPPRRRHSDSLHPKGQPDSSDLMQERLLCDSLPNTKLNSHFKQFMRGNLTYNGFEEHKKR